MNASLPEPEETDHSWGAISSPRESFGESMDIRSIERPTLVQVTAPWCAHCRSMSQDMIDLGDEFAGRVDLVTVDVSAAPRAAGLLGVKGTPTLIGVARGTEVFRETGRRARSELTEMFESLEKGHSLSSQRTGDAGLAIGAGSVLTLAGVVAGPAWVLVVTGMTVLGFGLMRALRARHA